MNNRGRVIRQLKEVPPQAGRDIYLTLDLKLQQYIETLLAGSRAAVVVTDPRTGAILALVSTPSYDPNLFVDGISSKITRAAQRPEHTAGQPSNAGLSAGVDGQTVRRRLGAERRVITRNTSLFDPGWWQLPCSEKRYRDWKSGATAI